MGTQHYHLKWKNHQFNALTVFEQLLLTESLVDVTLACDGLSLKAHRIVLSACSPYFQSLFLETPCQHPIVIMKDIKYTELKSVLDFMYRGEISVPHEELGSFIRTAEALKVKGLSEITSGVQADPVMCRQNPPQNNATGSSVTRSHVMSDLTSKKKARPKKRPNDCGYSDDDEAASGAKEPRSNTPLNSSVRGNPHPPSSKNKTSQPLVSISHSESSCPGELEEMSQLTEHSSAVHLASNSKSTVPLLSSSVNTDTENTVTTESGIHVVPPLSVGQDLGSAVSHGDNSAASIAMSTPLVSTGSLSRVKVSDKQHVPGTHDGPQPTNIICSYCKMVFSETRQLKDHILQAIAASDIGHFSVPLDRPK